MIWILLPAYDEEASLPRLLPKLDAALRSHGVTYRLVVVDDGSSDGTPALLADFARSLPLDVVRHAINRGLGETERDGFEYIVARCAPEDRIVRMDCDDTHEPEYIFSLLSKLEEGYEVVNTSRFQPGGGQVGVDGYRAAISWLANQFMRALFGIAGTRDYSCGYRAYRAQAVQDAIEVYGNNFIQLRGLGFTSTLEMIVKLHLLGCRFSEVPFVLRYDQKQSSSKMVGSITTLGYLMMALLYHWPFGGWASQFRHLRRLYRQDRRKALEVYGYRTRRLRLATRIGF